MTHTFPQVLAGIKRRAEILRNAGIIEHGSFAAYTPGRAHNPKGKGGGTAGAWGGSKQGNFGLKSKKRQAQDALEREPSLKALEVFTAPEE